MRYSYVSIFFHNGDIRFGSLMSEHHSLLAKSQYKKTLFKDKYGNWVINIGSMSGDIRESELLFDALSYLHGIGVLFGEDYKQHYSPAEIMREYQRSDKFKEPFLSVGFRGPGNPLIHLNRSADEQINITK